MRALLSIALCVVTLGLGSLQARQAASTQPTGRLFPPEDLGLLEAPDRVDWQRPDEVMDKLGIAEASKVADVGAGSGWFTIRLARRVGPNGIVYAEDVQPEMLRAIERRAGAERLRNIKPVLGIGSDPRLPARSLDAVLLVGAYHEVTNRVMLLRNLAASLRPGGRIGVIDFKLEGSGPGPDPEERVDSDTIIRDATKAGLQLQSYETFLPYQYLLIFGIDPSQRSGRPSGRPEARLKPRHYRFRFASNNRQTPGNTALAIATSTRSWTMKG